MSTTQVSIPFKREGSVGLFGTILVLVRCQSFNSLQTGRLGRTMLGGFMVLMAKVSIPFKREGSVGRSRCFLYSPTDGKFQFPSNGKARSDDLMMPLLRHEQKVSIPFKREGSVGRLRNRNKVVNLRKFQFPSNGKARSDSKILFVKRKILWVCFNSLQTGRLGRTFQTVL